MNLNQFKPGEGEEILEAKPKSKPSPRSQARQIALQALYQWQFNHSDMNDINKQFSEDGRFRNIDMALYNDIVRYISNHAADLDDLIEPKLDRNLSLVNPVEQNILRIAVYEFKEQPSIPYQVVINESVELAKLFGAEDAHKFVNGVLDKLAQDLRSLEFKQVKK